MSKALVLSCGYTASAFPEEFPKVVIAGVSDEALDAVKGVLNPVFANSNLMVSPFTGGEQAQLVAAVVTVDGDVEVGDELEVESTVFSKHV